MTQANLSNSIATLLFGLAIIHTFVAHRIHVFARRFPEDSIRFELCQLFGEVEAVFPLWGALLFVMIATIEGRSAAIQYAHHLDFKEPIFVFVIMVTAATAPVHRFASRCVESVAALISKSKILPNEAAVFFTALTLGPLLGSFITEPAAMTITALLLRDRFFERPISDRLKYMTMAVLFVNVSIGGVLTPYAAPPVLMVAEKWQWAFSDMLHLFGWKAMIAVVINASVATGFALRELKALPPQSRVSSGGSLPAWVIGLHLLALGGIVWVHNQTVFFIGLFLIFLALFNITRRYHEDLKLRESLLVASFLGGLVVLGTLQEWWLAPVIQALNATWLFVGTTMLTAITDNAALTYLGSQVEGLSQQARFALMAGAVSGGGLTVIANAPNPAGFSILQKSFGEPGVKPGRLLIYALIPTLVAMLCFWGLSH